MKPLSSITNFKENSTPVLGFSYRDSDVIVGKDEGGVSAGKLGVRHFDGLRECLFD